MYQSPPTIEKGRDSITITVSATRPKLK